ncbi:cytochrome P450 [Mycena alexandri]|uniref:Cytochrome P450 n=1 Tax=Mycena alexandri TaxID=1745969 RepID=A0AAD6TFL1_9AGAR|nr:cytochrome P450 [Mycena alexandri]
MSPTINYVYAASLSLLLAIRYAVRRRKLPENHPPIVDMPVHEMFNNPREAYENALKEHGPVIAVRRKGILEFIVDESLSQAVLTSDQSFSFEEAMAQVLNLRPYVSFFWSFFAEIDQLVQTGINPRLSTIFEQICPVFVRNADKAIEHRTVDMFEEAHSSIAEAMIVLIFGEGYSNERNIKVVIEVATDIAGLTGMYQNSSTLGRHFPTIWAIVTWVKVSCTSIRAFFSIIGPQVWRHVRSRKWVPGDEKPASVLEYLSYKHAKNGRIGFTSFLWIMSLLQGLIFASVHQTASVVVWVIFEIAMRPEYLKALREEVYNHVDPITHDLDPSNVGDAIQKAVWLDSFIREVMRTKGDTLAICRMTTGDINLGKYTLPKGHLVFPLATLTHLNPAYHPEPTVFRPERWHGENARPAVMSSISYIPFGFGRWACPGRILAVSEIKMIVWSIIVKATPRLEGNEYKIVDPLNVTSVPPEGVLILEPFSFS